MMSRTTGRSPSDRIDNETLNALCGLVCDRIEDLFDELGVRLYPGGKCYVGSCPVHGGRGSSSFNLYPDGYEVRGNWYCNSDKCHFAYPCSIIGFAWGVLSHQECGWARPGDRRIPYRVVVERLLKFVGLSDIADVHVDRGAALLRKASREVGILVGQTRNVQNVLCTRARYHEMVETPAPYYVGRGYSPEVLAKFEVGLVTARGSREFGRVIYPVYDERHTEIIGAVSRSTDPKCGQCKLCHEEGTPCPSIEKASDRFPHFRWRSVGFQDKQHLYNVWHARRYVADSRCVVVVEGAGDVWRLEEAGVRNVVGLFGSEFTDAQSTLLQSCVPRNVVVLTDNDEAGNKAAEQVERRMTISNVNRLLPVGAAEVGDMSVEDIKTYLVPAIEAKMRRK